MEAGVALKVCQKCKAACCKFGGADFTKIEMLKVLKAGYPDYFVELDDNHYEMKCKKGICPYLKKDNSCLIHKIRPLVCKSFPVYLRHENNKTKFLLIEYPLSQLLAKNDIKIKKNQASRVKEIIAATFSKSKLPKSDLKAINKRFNKFKRKKI